MNMPTLHSHTHCQVALANAQTKTWQRVCLSNRTIKTTDKQADEKEHRSDNKWFAKSGNKRFVLKIIVKFGVCASFQSWF